MLKIADVVFYTTSMKRSLSFYRQLLPGEWKGDDRFAECKIGGASLALKKAEEKREVPGHQTVILATSTIMEVYKRCKKLRVPVAKELSKESWGTNFAVLDPDGNKIEFVEE